MTIVIFILILVALIVVHEFGHFVVAKLSGMRVDEFGIGYPPRIWGKKYGETDYTINALPFGGFVRIYGEDESEEKSPHAFAARPRILQALTLIAGIAMNLLLAYLVITIMLAAGAPQALSSEEALRSSNASLMITSVLPGSPADSAGLKPGDRVVGVEGGAGAFSSIDATAFTNYVAQDTSAAPLEFQVLRGEETVEIRATPVKGTIASEPERPALGVSVATVGSVPMAWYEAPIKGAEYTWFATRDTAIGLAQFFGGVFTLTADLKQVSGPVGIAGAVGEAYDQGIWPLLTITALISINLALINLLPFPALDGGRLLFVIIESIIRRPIPSKFAYGLNFLGFGFLLLLMLVITASDIFKLVS